MPPRGRPRKVGLKRMDAAVENMRLLGFSDELVRTTVKRLLEMAVTSLFAAIFRKMEGNEKGGETELWVLCLVYEGDSGWLFIEEGSYKLLVDTILDEQENGLLKGDPSEVNARDDNNPSSAARTLPGVEDAAPLTNEIGGEDCNPPAEEERTDERDINLNQNPFHSPPTLISSTAPVDDLVKQKRRRFCGWISDNDEPDDIYTTKQLIPATVIQLERLISGTDTHSKSRWDEKPE